MNDVSKEIYENYKKSKKWWCDECESVVNIGEKYSKPNKHGQVGTCECGELHYIRDDQTVCETCGFPMIQDVDDEESDIDYYYFDKNKKCNDPQERLVFVNKNQVNKLKKEGKEIFPNIGDNFIEDFCPYCEDYIYMEWDKDDDDYYPSIPI